MSTTTGGPREPAACPGYPRLGCGDGRDNDGDGLVDLQDPDCIGPCDDDEGSFPTGLPGTWKNGCRVDCFFDANTGQGDDQCDHDLRCDPLEPGAAIGCEYSTLNCGAFEVTETCLDVCTPFVLPGCDCFGCCTFQLGDGQTVDRFIGIGDRCSADNLDGCAPCTSQIEVCGNICDVEGCEQCIGQSEPAPGCVRNVCDGGMPCEDLGDCPATHACMLGCCMPIPP